MSNRAEQHDARKRLTVRLVTAECLNKLHILLGKPLWIVVERFIIAKKTADYISFNVLKISIDRREILRTWKASHPITGHRHVTHCEMEFWQTML